MCGAYKFAAILRASEVIKRNNCRDTKGQTTEEAPLIRGNRHRARFTSLLLPFSREVLKQEVAAREASSFQRCFTPPSDKGEMASGATRLIRLADISSAIARKSKCEAAPF